MFGSLLSGRSTRGVAGNHLKFCSGLASFFLVSFSFAMPAMAAPFAYLSLGGNKVAVVDVANNSPVKEITVGTSPWGIAADPSGRYVYVANSGSNDVSVIDTQSNLVARTIAPMAAAGLPLGVAVNPNGSRIYVTNFIGNMLSVVDVASGLPLAQIPMRQPRSIAISPSGNFAYVGSVQADINAPLGSRSSAVVDLQQNRVIGEIPLDATFTSNILFSPDGSRAYFGEGSRISVINTSTHTIVAQWPSAIPGGIGLLGNIALSADGSRLYAVTYSDRKLITFDTATGSIVSSFSITEEPNGLVVDSARQTAILLGEKTGLAMSINLNTGEITKSYTLGGSPKAFGSVVTNGAPAQQVDSGGIGGGGGGCGYLSGNGGPPDPTLPFLAMLALLMLASRGRFMRR